MVATRTVVPSARAAESGATGKSQDIGRNFCASDHGFQPLFAIALHQTEPSADRETPVSIGFMTLTSIPR